MNKTSTATLILMVTLLSSEQVTTKRCENGKLMKIPDYKTLCVPIEAQFGECEAWNVT
jgi:hypothetical protein